VGKRSGAEGRFILKVLLVPMVVTLWLAIPPAALAAQYDGTNPGATACGNGSHTVYRLGARNASNPTGSEGFATNIVYNGTVIGTVEIRHSAYCATVWSRVTNLTGSSLQAHETIVLYSDSNGNGRTEYQYPTTDTLPANGGVGLPRFDGQIR
jgi:hypothetical protein